jgi:uncharacterized integral membrane protein
MVTWGLVTVIIIIIFIIIVVIINTSTVKVFYMLVRSPWKVVSFEVWLWAQEFSEVLID